MVGGISGWQLLILLLIVVLVFGTKRLRNIGSDLGSAIKGFRKGMEDTPESAANDSAPEQISSAESADPKVDEAAADTPKEKDPAARQPGSDV